MTRSENASGRTLSGRHVLFGLLAFFGVIVVVDSFMIYKAVTTFGGLETTDAYRKGLAYNDRIALAEAQAKRGWSDEIVYEAETGRLRVSLVDRQGDGVSGVEVKARVSRPATDRFDRTVWFTQTAPGAYEADATGIEPGWWTIQITANRSSEDDALYQARHRLWIKP